MSDRPDRWADAIAAARLLARLPFGLGGVRLRARPGPAREAWLGALLENLPPGVPVRRFPPGADPEALASGLDLAATLASGRPVLRPGLIAEASGGLLLVPVAERLAPGAAAVLAEALDAGRPVLVVALDEGGAEEGLPPVLAERLALWVDLEGLRPGPAALGPAGEPVAEAEAADALCRAAAALGLLAPRPAILALAAARGLAAAAGRPPASGDFALAARLVLALRARQVPEAAEAAAADGRGGELSPAPAGDQPGDGRDGQDARLADLLVEAARAVLPPGLEAAVPGAARGTAAGAGRSRAATHAAGRRGRPAGVRARPPRSGERLALVETLRAAAPWQPVRRRERPSAGRLDIRKADLRTRRLVRPAETSRILLVDASGSAALGRLAEAKGAAALLLARAYARRDEVALVAFRGERAEILLPPTRALARARRAIAELPGGGGTPIAHALDLGLQLARGCRARGRVPLLVLMTDGRANVARAAGLDPMADAEAAARAVRAAGIAAVLVDVSPRPRAEGAWLAEALGARRVPLPRADAARLATAVEEAR